MDNLEKITLEIRRLIFRTVCLNKAGHLASSLSSVEILVGLYFGNILRYNVEEYNYFGGLRSLVADVLTEVSVAVNFEFIGFQDEYCFEYGWRQEIRKNVIYQLKVL